MSIRGLLDRMSKFASRNKSGSEKVEDVQTAPAGATAEAPGVPPVVIPPESLNDIRKGLKFLPGCKIKYAANEPEEEVESLAGPSGDQWNEIVRDTLNKKRDPSSVDQNNLACALMWLNSTTNWAEAEAALRAATDPKVAPTAAVNLVVLGRLRRAARGSQ